MSALKIIIVITELRCTRNWLELFLSKEKTFSVKLGCALGVANLESVSVNERKSYKIALTSKLVTFIEHRLFWKTNGRNLCSFILELMIEIDSLPFCYAAFLTK